MRWSPWESRAAEPAARPRVNAANLAAVLSPRSVAIVGASNDPIRWGGAIITNIISGGYPGRLYPVALRAETVFGLPAYPSVSALPEAPDLAVIAVPAPLVKGIVDECGRKGVRAVVVISAGFSEMGTEGAALQREVAEAAAGHGMAMIGPNCMGVVSSWSRFYAVGAAHVHTEPSPAGIVSQSGNAGVQLMVSAQRRGAGLGKFVSIGNEGLFAIPDLLDFFREDPETGVVGAYIEGFEDGRALLDERPPSDRPQALRGASRRHRRVGPQGGRLPHRRHGRLAARVRGSGPAGGHDHHLRP